MGTLRSRREMKKALGLLILILPIMACGSKQKVLKQVDDLSKQKKYLTAYSLLEKSDPYNKNIDFVLAKVQIALDDYLTTDLLQTFTFKDISLDENIENFRGQPVSGTVFILSPEVTMNALSLNHHGNLRLFEAQGDYEYLYYCNYDRFGKDKGLFRLQQAQNYYYQALSHQAMNPRSLYRMGRILLTLEEYQEAAKNLSEAIAQGYQTADSYYYLALAQSNTRELSHCVENGQKALSIYTRSEEKVSAARLVAQAYMGTGDEKSAMKYFEIVSELRPKNYLNLKSLLTLNLSHKATDKAFILAKTMLATQPKNQEIHWDIYEAYDRFKCSKEFYDFLEKMKSLYAKQDEVMGDLYFYQAKADAGARRSNEAVESLKKAKLYFSKVLKPKDKIFKTIDDQIKELNGRK